MARQRRGGGFRAPELRGTLGTLLRTTLAQAGSLRDALERGAREGRSRLDSALATRRRQEALAELGDIVLDLIRQGEIDLAELPEARDIVAHLEALDSDLAEEDEDADVAPPARMTSRRRGSADDDGTVSSSATWAPPTRATKQPKPRVWRPPVDDAAPAADAKPPRERQSRVTTQERPKSARKGGISFEEDDEDLADYMHPDDVPPKGSPEGDA